jgi:hypothetical protein
VRAELGIEDRSVKVPSHFCAFDRGEEQLRERQSSFLRLAVEGKRQGILFVGPPGGAETLLRHLEVDLGVDLTKQRESGMIALAEGDADADQMLENILRPIEAMVARGARLVRVVMRAQWGGPQWPEPEDFVWLESRLNDAIADLPVVMCCAYDIFKTPGPALILAGLHSHPSYLCGRFAERNDVFEPHKRHLQTRMVDLPWLAQVEQRSQ